MAKTTTDALEILRDQHLQFQDLVEQIEEGGDREALFAQLADIVAAHSEIEEKIFYPSLLEDDTRELLLKSTEEHLAVKRELADLLELDVTDERFLAKLEVMKDLFLHHALDEEERVLFPIVRKKLDADERAALGNEMIAMFEQLIEKRPREQVPAETEVAAQL